MELTPRTLGDEAPVRRRRRRWLPISVILVVLAAGGLILAQGLRDATLFFRNADEAVAQRDSLGDRRFRLQGTVDAEPVQVGNQVSFPVAFNEVAVDVLHDGDPPELFRPGVPVVLEGRWADGEDVFTSDRMLIRHDEEYVEQDEYDERVREAERRGGADATSQTQTEPNR